jgi:DNA-binding response OmpR family regulator
MVGVRTLLVGGDDGPVEDLVDRMRELSADVVVVADGPTALRHLRLIEPEMILIRKPLPGALDAFETCRALRSVTDAILVIFATVLSPHDEIVALAVGADHLLPFDMPLDLAIARLRALVRRKQGMLLVSGDASVVASRRPVALMGGSVAEELDDRLEEGDLQLDLLAREARVGGELVELTRIEFDLLAALAHHPRRVLTRDELKQAVWGTTFDGSHVLDAHLSRLRCKIRHAGGEKVAHAVRGVGYRLRA